MKFEDAQVGNIIIEKNNPINHYLITNKTEDLIAVSNLCNYKDCFHLTKRRILKYELYNPEWFCTDTDSFQHCKEHGNGKYSFIEIVWLDTVEGDPGYPDKEYTVKSAFVDLNDYDEKEREIAIAGYYDSLEVVYAEYEDAAEQIIAECIFEEMTEGSASTYGMMTREEAEKFVKIYIEDH